MDNGGLGFDYKWNLGWMDDTLKYFECHPYNRAFMSDKITFSIFYAYNERYILPFSHDEVVHGKKTIIDKLHGTYEDKFAQARLLYLYMMTHPGKKLNFMGNELAMFREWDEKREPDWNLLNLPAHNAFHCYISELNMLYLNHPALWELDHTYDGFKWLDCNSDNKCVFAYIRTGKEESALAIFNFSDKEAAVSPQADGNFTLLLNTDWEIFGGKTKKADMKKLPDKLSPYSGLFYQYQAI